MKFLLGAIELDRNPKVLADTNASSKEVYGVLGYWSDGLLEKF